MIHHVEHDSRFDGIGMFQGGANEAAGLPVTKGRDLATPDQLAHVEDWMLARIKEHCDTHGCVLPKAARPGAP